MENEEQSHLGKVVELKLEPKSEELETSTGIYPLFLEFKSETSSDIDINPLCEVKQETDEQNMDIDSDPDIVSDVNCKLNKSRKHKCTLCR